MKQTGHRYGFAVSGAFAALWAIEFGVGEPPELPFG
jgi:hypothetical protein